MNERLIAMSASGRFVALRRRGGVEVVDVKGTAPRRSYALADGGDFGLAGNWLCLVDHELRAVELDGPRSATLAVDPGEVRAFGGRTADAVMIGGALIALVPTPHVVRRAASDAMWFPLAGRAVLTVAGDRLAIAAGSQATALDVAAPGAVVGVASLFQGRSVAILVATRATHEVVVVQASGALVRRIPIPAARWHAFAPARGQLFVGAGDDDVVVIDLRYGMISGQGKAPHRVSALAVDDDGRELAIGSDGSDGVPIVSLIRCEELFASSGAALTEPPPAPAPAVEPRRSAEPRPEPVVDEAVLELVPYGLGAPPAPLPQVPPVASPTDVGRAAPPEAVRRWIDATPFCTAREHLGALVDLVATRAALAIAESWHTGRISADAADHFPFEREVLGLAGESCALAGDRVAAAHERLRARSEIVAARSQATLYAGIALPFVAIAHELALSEIATQVLLAVVAPQVRPEIARLYRILGNETQRPACDESLLCQLLANGEAEVRDAILDELAPDAPLLRSRAIVRTGAALEVAPALLARLRGRAIPTTAAARRRTALRALDELHVDRAVVNGLIRELATPRSAPARVVVRGSRGSGRHTVIAAIAGRIGCDIVAIDAAQLPRATFADELARELANALLTHAIPVVSGLELAAAEADHDDTQRVRRIIAEHRGAVVVRAGGDALLPLAPGFVEISLPGLTERQRDRAFAAALAEVGVAADSALLARRFRIGPGAMHAIARDAATRLGEAASDVTAATRLVDELARQHVASRIGSTAQRVTRLADWDHVALPEDMLDSLRELVGRARHVRTVYEDWGYDARITTSRGLTALFYGPPGTGKTMVAGLVARELGLELYRVDLSKVLSKWVGETEKNLGEVFDAAQDGQIMLLFDEADSLFSKRSEVKSSNDRYANIEVNYLLQRLDTFEGVAILTTNLEGSIDPAFKRRLSMRLYFPFPDEDMRARLWETHVMPRVPIAGKLDFPALARRFPLSGGYIRNSALRAAFLAAQEQTELSQAHLERAVLLEYRELGKLAQDGRME